MALRTGILSAMQIGLPFDDAVPTVASSIAPTSGSPVTPTIIAIAPAFGSPVPPPIITIAPTSVSPVAPAGVNSIAPLYFVRHRRARRYLLRVEPDGRLRVTIPRGGSKRDAEAFALRNVGWVRGQRERLSASPVNGEDRATARARAAVELPPRLRELATQHGVTGLTRISIRNQRTRWGSCGRDGHISLNWRLVLMPSAVRDYVLIHELMHLRRMDHSPTYWKLVSVACPDFGSARQWLRAHGRELR